MFKLSDDSDFRVLTVEPKMDQKTKTQRVDRDDVPQWTVTALYFTDEEIPRPELVKVTLGAHSQPDYTPMETGLLDVEMGMFKAENGTIVFFKTSGLVALEAA